MKIGIIGYGDLGKQVEQFLLEEGVKTEEIIPFDDNYIDSGRGFPFEFYANPEFESCKFIVCLGYKHLVLKKKILSSLENLGRIIYCFIHHSSYISPSAKIGKGVIIYPMCNIDQRVKIEDGVVLNNSVTVSHDSSIGNSSFLAPAVVLSGCVDIGNCVFIGAGTCVANNISIGSHSIIGIGSAVINSIPENSNCIGNPLVFKREIEIK